MSRRSLGYGRQVVRWVLLLFVAAAFASGGAAFGAEPGKGGLLKQDGGEKTPTVITSKKMNADNKARTILFTVDVVVVKGDMNIYADEMTVYYTDDGKEVDRIVCKGNVKIVKGARTAVSREAVYYSREADEKVVLTGDPKVWEGNNMVTGTRITLLLTEDRSIVEESRVTLYPKGKE